MVQRPDGPVQDGQQRVRQNFCPVEQLQPLPMIDTFRAWWFWRRHEVVRHVLSQVFAKFQGVVGEQIFLKKDDIEFGFYKYGSNGD